MRNLIFLFFAAISFIIACQQQESESSVPPSQERLAADTGTKMVWIAGGTFLMGTTNPEFPDAAPQHEVQIDGFWMDEHEVTNAEFSRFVQATGYLTIAETDPDPADFPGLPAEALYRGSAVFVAPARPVSLQQPIAWWEYRRDANWRQPAGPGSKMQPNFPVVHICYEDALAYAQWAGKRLPTEAEWEYAARAGKNFKSYYWGDEQKISGKWMANIYQGDFPFANRAEDGFSGLAPVKSFPPNHFGLYDMEGNVWEWCNDFYRPDYYANSPSSNPQGPADSFDPVEPGVVKRVQRGGSFMCSDQYCIRYKAGARGKGEIKSAADNLGFRCVRSAAG